MPMSSSACKAMVLPEPDRPLTTMSFICPSAHARALSLRELRRRVVPAPGQEMTAPRGLAERGQGAPRRHRQGDANKRDAQYILHILIRPQTNHKAENNNTQPLEMDGKREFDAGYD